MWTFAAYVGVFLEGVLSFLSPCVLPLLPVYLSLLAGDGGSGKRRRYLNTLAFVLGISLVFFLLGFSFTALGKLFAAHQLLFMRLGGIVIVFLGLFQLGLFDWRFLMRERRIAPRFHGPIGPGRAFLLGLAFSFGWTPCVGPALSSVLILAATSQKALVGGLLIGLYSLGFLLPFLLLTLFAGRLFDALRQRGPWLERAGKISGGILVLLGLLVFFGFAGLAGPLSPAADAGAPSEASSSESEARLPAPDFTLQDASGKRYTLSDFKGRVVLLNFWATWCPPCRAELPDMDKVARSLDPDEAVLLTITLPGGREKDPSGIEAFVREKDYELPVLFDMDGAVFEAYQIRAFPTTYVIDAEGRLYGVAQGALNERLIQKAIRDAGKGA